MAELQTAHHTPLNLLAAVKWADEFEGYLHKFLDKHRLHGEWFEASEEVLWLVEKMRDVESLEQVVDHFDHFAFFPWLPEGTPGLNEYRHQWADNICRPPAVRHS